MFHFVITFLTLLHLIKDTITISVGAPINTPMPGRIVIIAPSPGQALQGRVAILGSTAVDGFQTYELTFTYFGESTDTWFLIQESNTPILEGELAQWDTSLITDGDYSLRLTVTLIDGRKLTELVPLVRVRNYTLIETDTPSPTLTLAPMITVPATGYLTLATMAIPSSPTPLPTNPASLSMEQIASGWEKGVIIVLSVMALFGLYQALHRSIRKS